MKLYTVIWNDRHSDTTAHVFSDVEEAVKFAKKSAKEYCRYLEDFEETVHENDNQGWVYSVIYSCEGDSIHVVETTLDKDVVKGESE